MSQRYNKMQSRDDSYLPVDPTSRSRYHTFPVGESKTRQAAKHQTDVNLIVARFQETGQLPPSNRQPQYADVSNLQEHDLTSAHNLGAAVRAGIEVVERKRRAKKATPSKTAQEPVGDEQSSTPNQDPPKV